MRQPFVLAATVAALCAVTGEAAAQSRYGPPPSALAWPGKSPPPAQPETAEIAAPAAPVRPEPLAPWAQRLASLTPPAPITPPPAPALPKNLYDTPPAPVAAPIPAPIPAPALPAPRTPVRPAAPQAAAAPEAKTPLLGGPAPQAAPAPVQTAANPGPRFYSVYREYGVKPDSIPVAPEFRGQETSLKELPSTPSLATQDDTQYVPARPLNSSSSANTTTKRAF